MTKSKTNRRTMRTVALLLTMLMLAVTGTVFWAKTSDNMEWYASPPIDAQGHKVHILCPHGWKPAEEGYKRSWKTVDGDLQIELMSNDDEGVPEIGVVQEWLIKLKIMPRPEQISGTVQLIISSDVNASWGQKPGTQGPDGKLRYPAGNADSLACATRAIVIPGSKLQAGVMYYGATGRIGGKSVEAAICNSMFVE